MKLFKRHVKVKKMQISNHARDKKCYYLLQRHRCRLWTLLYTNVERMIFLIHSQQVGDNPAPVRSRFTIVELPGLEKLSDDPNQLRHREGPALSKALIGLNQVVTQLSSNPFPDRVINYR